MAKHTKSVFDKALGPRSKKKRGRDKFGGLAAMADGKRGRRKVNGLQASFNSMGGIGSGSRRRRKGMAAQVWSSIRERMTPTQRAQIREEADRAIEDDTQLRGYRADQRVTDNETFIQRLIRLARERLARP